MKPEEEPEESDATQWEMDTARKSLRRVVAETGGVDQAAEALGVSVRTIYNWLRNKNINKSNIAKIHTLRQDLSKDRGDGLLATHALTGPRCWLETSNSGDLVVCVINHNVQDSDWMFHKGQVGRFRMGIDGSLAFFPLGGGFEQLGRVPEH